MQALLNQCHGVALAMQAIREVIPSARLVQTEDLGKTFAVPRLAYQARFENERRWLLFTSTPTGAMSIPVYVDGAESEDLILVHEEEDKKTIPN